MDGELDMNIIVPATDLEKIGTTSIPIPGQSGNYIAGLSVYHELHCLVTPHVDIFEKIARSSSMTETYSKTHLAGSLLPQPNGRRSSPPKIAYWLVIHLLQLERGLALTRLRSLHRNITPGDPLPRRHIPLHSPLVRRKQNPPRGFLKRTHLRRLGRSQLLGRREICTTGDHEVAKTPFPWYACPSPIQRRRRRFLDYPLIHPIGAAFPDGHSFKLGAVEDNSKTIDP